MTKITKKRRLASADEVKIDLRHKLPLFNEAFELGVERFNQEISSTPVSARIKSLEATLLNAKMVQSLQDFFPSTFSFGKHKRVIGSFPGYQILVKKLDDKGMPMNIKTKNAEAISNQLQLSLFDATKDVQDAVLFFGYRKNRIGQIVDPQIICIDEGSVIWRIDLSNYSTGHGDASAPLVNMPIAPISTLPVLRVKEEAKKAQ